MRFLLKELFVRAMENKEKQELMVLTIIMKNTIFKF